MDEVIRYNVEGDGYLFYEAKEGDWIKAEDLDALQQKLTNLNKELEEYRSIAEKVGATVTEPLAREKVEQACGRLQDLYPHLKNIQLILNIDAALRRRLAETQDENRWHRQIITIMQKVANELITEAQNAKVKL